MHNWIVLFVEGETEVEFYKKLIAHIRNECQSTSVNIKFECKNVKGIGGFKKEALRKFLKEIVPKLKKDDICTIALCRDTDIFEYSAKPPIKWETVRNDFKANGAKKVIEIKAKHSIEDWFLHDLDGILDFLNLPKGTKASGKNGCEKIKYLYRKANKMYYKGVKSKNLIDHLDMGKIISKEQQQLKVLLDILEYSVD